MKSIQKFIKIAILRIFFSKLESNYYTEALYIKEGKSKIFHAAKKLANEKHDSDGKRYYVIDNYDNNGQFVVLNSNEISKLKSIGTFRKDLNFIQMASVASYQTT